MRIQMGKVRAFCDWSGMTARDDKSAYTALVHRRNQSGKPTGGYLGREELRAAWGPHGFNPPSIHTPGLPEQSLPILGPHDSYIYLGVPITAALDHSAMTRKGEVINQLLGRIGAFRRSLLSEGATRRAMEESVLGALRYVAGTGLLTDSVIEDVSRGIAQVVKAKNGLARSTITDSVFMPSSGPGLGVTPPSDIITQTSTIWTHITLDRGDIRLYTLYHGIYTELARRYTTSQTGRLTKSLPHIPYKEMGNLTAASPSERRLVWIQRAGITIAPPTPIIFQPGTAIVNELSLAQRVSSEDNSLQHPSPHSLLYLWRSGIHSFEQITTLSTGHPAHTYAFWTAKAAVTYFGNSFSSKAEETLHWLAYSFCAPVEASYLPRSLFPTRLRPHTINDRLWTRSSPLLHPNPNSAHWAHNTTIPESIIQTNDPPLEPHHDSPLAEDLHTDTQPPVEDLHPSPSPAETQLKHPLPPAAALNSPPTTGSASTLQDGHRPSADRLDRLISTLSSFHLPPSKRPCLSAPTPTPGSALLLTKLFSLLSFPLQPVKRLASTIASFLALLPPSKRRKLSDPTGTHQAPDAPCPADLPSQSPPFPHSQPIPIPGGLRKKSS